MSETSRKRLTLLLLCLGAVAYCMLAPALLLFERAFGGGPGSPWGERLLARAMTRQRGGKIKMRQKNVVTQPPPRASSLME